MKVRVGITMGAAAGIGPEIIAKSLSKKSVRDLAEFTIVGDKWVFSRLPFTICNLANIKFIDLDNISHRNFSFGKIRPEYGRASIEYIKKAVSLVQQGHLDCIVTAPVSKKEVNLVSPGFKGQTEYLASLTGSSDFVMMLCNRYLKIALVSRHISLGRVCAYLSRNRIYRTILTTYRGLKRWFAIIDPRLVVCALNPHASDGGLLGRQEEDLIIPAIKQAARKIKNLSGPLPCDIALLRTKDKEYDCAVAMYHDQALIPLKVTDPEQAANITLGLPFIRTSPLHGTAFDIAGKNRANPVSFITAIKIAVKCTINRLSCRAFC
jgi:4-hydroxythreonine-4-phosphate dehydrogenase